MGEPLVVFEDPPTADAKRAGRWTPHLRLVMARPGEWARVTVSPKRKAADSIATSIRRGKGYCDLAAGGSFETVARALPDGSPGAGVWVRYLPPPGAESEPLPPVESPAAAPVVEVAPPEPHPPPPLEAVSPTPASVAAPRRQFSEQVRQAAKRARSGLSLVQRQHLLGLARQEGGGEAFVVKVNVTRALMSQRLVEDTPAVRKALLAGDRGGANYALTDLGHCVAAMERGSNTTEDVQTHEGGEDQ